MVDNRVRSASVRFFSVCLAVTLMLAASVASAQPRGRSLERVLAVQNRHSAQLMEIEGVVGTGTGLAPDGLPAVIVYCSGKNAGPLPTACSDVPIVVHETGRISALKRPVPPPSVIVDPTDRFDAPVPIGVSTGNEFFYGVGTIGCRLVGWLDGGTSCCYALSNHHVFDPYDAVSDDGIPQRVVQPGRGDDPSDNLLGEATQENLLGGIVASVPINYSGGANQVDAAIAEVPIVVVLDDGVSMDTRQLGTSTPEGGYGAPVAESEVTSFVGMSVQKYGRTTLLTKGSVQAVNVSIQVTYDMVGSVKTALFTGQIAISGGRSTFVKPGDSGSLIVTDPGRDAVGLLFAGDARGRTGFANPIGLVLEQLADDLADREGLPVNGALLYVDGN